MLDLTGDSDDELLLATTLAAPNKDEMETEEDSPPRSNDKSPTPSDGSSSDEDDEGAANGAQSGVKLHGGEKGLEGQANGIDNSMDVNTAKMSNDSGQLANHTAASPSKSTTSTAYSYLSSVHQRQSLFYPAADAPLPSSYSIESIFTIPQATATHSLYVPPSSSHIYAGGQDGLIRRYNLHATLNGTGSEHSNNYTVKLGGTIPLDSRTPVLVGIYENEEEGKWVQEDEKRRQRDGDKFAWGPKVSSSGESPVYSLAVQDEELWGVSGTAKGSINLWTIRHDEGQIRHVFKSSSVASKGHRKSPVSVLTLAPDQKSLLSGGWDGQILEWDLDTGVASRHFEGHGGQLSSISYRPISNSIPTPPPTKPVDSVDVDMPHETPGVLPNTLLDSKAPATGVLSPASSSSSSTGVAAALVQPSATSASTSPHNLDPPEPKKPDLELVDDGRSSSEADADGDVDDDPHMVLPSTSSLVANDSLSESKLPPSKSQPQLSKSIPIVGGSTSLPQLSNDVFLSTSVNGMVLIWDKRIKNGDTGSRRRFESSGKHSNWCTSACWSPSGQEVYVGRRSSLIETYDLRHSSPTNPVLHSLQLPFSSGAVSVVKALPSGKHIISGSSDTIRLWDLTKAAKGAEAGRGVPWIIIPGYQGTSSEGIQSSMISSLHIDPLARFLICASGNRGWEGSSTEDLVIHEIKSFY